MSRDSTSVFTRRKSTRLKPLKKPRPDFPLGIHKGSGQWCKKVRGKVHYFGRVADDPKGKAAHEEWDRVKEDLYAGREPREKTDGLTVADLANRFLTHKEGLRDSKELSPRTFATYHAACAMVVKVFGSGRVVTDLIPEDFRKLRNKLAETRAAVSLRNEMQRIRSIFKFAFDDGLILAPVRFGQGFAKPKPEVVRRARESHRAEHGDRMFEADELRLILEALAGNEVETLTPEKPERVRLRAQPALRAMVLLGINCGFGQTDVSALPLRAVDLDSGWIDFPRPKTGVPRKCPIWPETIQAIRDWLPHRPKAKVSADAGLLFLTRCGARWVKWNENGSPCDAVIQEFNKSIRALNLKRHRIAFYALRHGFETIAGETADQVAVDAIMGHVATGMAGLYRERISDERLRRVVDHVRSWLFDAKANGGEA